LLARPGIGGGGGLAAVKGVDQLHFQTHRVEFALQLGPHLLQQTPPLLLKVCGLGGQFSLIYYQPLLGGDYFV